MRYDGTRATVRATTAKGGVVEVVDHSGGDRRHSQIPLASSGHGGGDGALMHDFLAAAAAGHAGRSDAAEALESHLLAFLAEEARIGGGIIDVTARRQAVT